MSMFWGLAMKPNRKYSQTILKSFHISGVALDEGDSAKLYLTAEKQKYVVATISKAVPQVQLDLNFSKGDNIVFQTIGNATVSLLGYLHDIEESDDEEYDEEEFAAMTKALAKKGLTGNNDEESGEEEEEEDDDDDENDDNEIIKEYSSFLEEGEEDSDVDEEGEEEEEEEDDSEDEEEQPPKAKQPKLDASAKKPAKEQNGVAKTEQKPLTKKEKKAAAAAAVETKKKDVKKEAVKEAKPAPAKERVITGGVKIEDVRAGSGPEAKQGKRVSVYYIGRLQSNNKTFDSMQKGNGFKFALGAGEVIKGWDVGVAGMKVGGKRRITCPPHMAYGARGNPPTIPHNSTLVFDVELKAVH